MRCIVHMVTNKAKDENSSFKKLIVVESFGSLCNTTKAIHSISLRFCTNEIQSNSSFVCFIMPIFQPIIYLKLKIHWHYITSMPKLQLSKYHLEE